MADLVFIDRCEDSLLKIRTWRPHESWRSYGLVMVCHRVPPKAHGVDSSFLLFFNVVILGKLCTTFGQNYKRHDKTKEVASGNQRWEWTIANWSMMFLDFLSWNAHQRKTSPANHVGLPYRVQLVMLSQRVVVLQPGSRTTWRRQEQRIPEATMVWCRMV